MTSLSCCRAAAGVLLLLAAALLVADIALGVHYDNLTDVHLNDTERITTDLVRLQDSYKSAVQIMKGAKKQVDDEKGRQKQTTWELEHQTKRTQQYETQIKDIQEDIASLRAHISMLNDGCTHCPEGWIFMNSLCYYFTFASYYRALSWDSAQKFCKAFGGDLAIIDSKDKESSVVSQLIRKLGDQSQVRSESVSLAVFFWIGLTDVDNEGTWKWVNGTELIEGYWADGEPNNNYNEDCAIVYPKENFFKAWIDRQCKTEHRWICEKAPTIRI